MKLENDVGTLFGSISDVELRGCPSRCSSKKLRVMNEGSGPGRSGRGWHLLPGQARGLDGHKVPRRESNSSEHFGRVGCYCAPLSTPATGTLPILMSRPSSFCLKVFIGAVLPSFSFPSFRDQSKYSQSVTPSTACPFTSFPQRTMGLHPSILLDFFRALVTSYNHSCGVLFNFYLLIIFNSPAHKYINVIKAETGRVHCCFPMPRRVPGIK